MAKVTVAPGKGRYEKPSQSFCDIPVLHYEWAGYPNPLPT